jgi:hypothetical protein
MDKRRVDVNMSRKSNAGEMQHDQIIHFINGSKRLIQGVQFVWENEMTHIVDYLGVEYIVNKSNVLFVERFSKGGEGNVKNQSGAGREVVVGPGGPKRRRA